MHILPLLFILLVGGPIFAKNYTQRLDNAYQLIFKNLDEAQQELTKLEAESARLTATQKGQLETNWGVFSALMGQNSAAKNHFWKAYALAPKSSDSRIATLLNIANVQRAEGQYKAANVILHRAYLYYKRKGQLLRQLSVEGEIASNHYYLMNWERAIKMNLHIIEGFKKLKEQHFLAMQQQRLGNIYFSLDRFEDALPLFKASLKYYDQAKNEELNAGYLRITLGNLYFKTKAYALAERYYKEAAQKLAQRDFVKYWIAKAHFAKVMLAEGDTQRGYENLIEAYKALREVSVIYLDEILMYLLDYSDAYPKYNSYLRAQIAYLKEQKNNGVEFNGISYRTYMQSCAGFYEQNGMHTEAMNVLKTLRVLDKEVNMDLVKEKSERILDRAEFEKELLEIKYLKAEIVRFRLVQGIWALSIILLIFVSVTLFLINQSKIREKTIQNLKLKLDNTNLHEQLELEHENLRLEQELKQAKERELAAMSLQFHQFNESLKNELASLEEKSGSIELRSLQKKLSNSESYQDYWKEFKLKFTQLNPNFFTHLKLKYPELTPKELDFCALVRLNLSNKEIAAINQISYESVISKKYKLRKKLQIETEAELLSMLMEL